MVIISLTGIDDLFAITTELADVSVKWKNIGLALHLHPPLLNEIDNEKPTVLARFQEMLMLWLSKAYDWRKYGEPSWALLERAVRAKNGGNNPSVAEQIRTSHVERIPYILNRSSIETLV